jgi:CMP-N,N'-diacetyllegionaminic acid synthase
MTKKILSLIPARAGSKRLLQKNMAVLGGRPLIAWTIEASLNSKYITKTVVSSDSKEILKIAKEYGADFLKRPGLLANDTASSESVVAHALESIEEKFNYIVLLQPTSPLRKTEDIDNSFEKLFRENVTALISVCETDNKILKAFKENKKGFLEGLSNNKYPFMRRQDLPKTYMSNGAIYIVKVSDFLKNNSFYTDRTISYVMHGDSNLDIDTKDDLKKAENCINQKNNKVIFN